jgi:hypothetical protein
VRRRHCGELGVCTLVHGCSVGAGGENWERDHEKNPGGTEAKFCKRFALGAGPIGDPQSPGPITSGAIKGYMPDRCLCGIRHPRRHLDTTPLRSPASRYPQALCGRVPLQSLLQAVRLLEGEAVCLREDGPGRGEALLLSANFVGSLPPERTRGLGQAANFAKWPSSSTAKLACIGVERRRRHLPRSAAMG